MVYIGGASINELGKNEGGLPGDQNGKEVYIQPWYNHQKGWVIIRAKDKVIRQKMAVDMRYACENENVGYSYWEHCYSLYNEAKKYDFDISKVKVPVETNCAKLVLCCAKYAGINVEDFSTMDEAEKFEKTGMFEIIRDKDYTSNPDALLTGDILVTASKGHTVIVTKGNDEMPKFNWCSTTTMTGYYKLLGDAHVRIFPTTESVSLGVVYKDSEVFCSGIVCVDSTGKIWYHAYYNNEEGFISEKLLEFNRGY